MKIILIGSSKTDCIIDASKHLAKKYLPGFDIIYLKFDRDLEYWSIYLSGFLFALKDEYIIFGHDDFLFASPIDGIVYSKALNEIGGDVVSVKLCYCTEEEHKEYPVTAQMTIWNREYLISLLENTNSPWNFERRGSQLFDKKCLLRSCINYYTNSSTSNRWEGYRLDGLSESDINELKELGYVS